ncbi:hypothetical protein BSL82_03625 [Tardibacter chloracetimidivorans]|uniref:Uncharacterized protein n=1 Tax=Tardibacter chloracetimidivorans TaxID=1921510 RepID=A0A1L3ZSA5_9SPHN|nr:hypothetical protein [Tardibacter chloracetimidivorans]API58507.1 hypothetical protein BSL82_03625 [Tardibacter chloracetimidivorans]
MKQKIERMREVAAFLCGHARLEGYWFDDTVQGQGFWWRRHLAEAVTDILSHIDALEARVEKGTADSDRLFKIAVHHEERAEAAERALAEAVKERDALRSASTIIRQRDEAWRALVWVFRNGFRHSSECPPEVNMAFSDAFAPERQANNTVLQMTGKTEEEIARAFLTKRGEK